MATTRSIELAAVTMTVDEAGAGGRPLLLVHGFTGARNDFDTVIDPLAELGWHVVVPDQRGHGDTTHLGVEEAYSFETFTSDLLDLVGHLGWDDFVLLGHSMGGMIAQVLTLAAPRRVRALVLMDTSCRNVDIDPDLAQLGITIAREQGLETLVALQRDIEDPLATDAHKHLCETVPGYEERNERNTLASDPAMYASMARAIVEPHDRLGLLDAITCPTLVLVGEEDVPFIDASKAMADTIPNASLVMLPGAGHSPQFEAPDAWWAAMKPFLNGI